MSAARVVGAGLSGLVAAWHLADRGASVTVIDRASCAGGLIGTIATPHGLVETAANAFVWDPVVESWFTRLDLTPVYPLRTSGKRYIFRNGRPRRWPLSIGESVGMAGRLGVAALTRSFAARDAESMAGWADRVTGTAAREWLVEPAMQGIYASPASVLSAQAIFGGRKRGPRRLAAPQQGMGQIIERLHQRLVEKGVRFEFNRALDAVEAGQPTVIATGAHSAARLLSAHAPRLSERIAAVRMAHLTTVTMFFTPDDRDVHGFGILFPARSGVRALGVLFNADIFPGRGTARSETWIVGDRDAALTGQSDAALQDMLAGDRRRVTGRDDRPLAVHITRWPDAIPVYDQAILGLANELPSLPPWLALAGNYLGKIGVAALLAGGEAAAARVLAASQPAIN